MTRREADEFERPYEMFAIGIAVPCDLLSQLKFPLQPQNMSRHSGDDFSGVVRGRRGQGDVAVGGLVGPETRPTSFTGKAISRRGRCIGRLERDLLGTEEMPIVV